MCTAFPPLILFFLLHLHEVSNQDEVHVEEVFMGAFPPPLFFILCERLFGAGLRK